MVIKKPLYRYGTIDSGSLCRLFREPDVYIPSSDDNTHPRDIMRFIDNALAVDQIFILGRNPKTEAFIFSPSHNATTFQAHLAIRKDCRDGLIAYRTAEAAKWIFDNTTCKTIVCHVRAENKGIRVVLAQLGMKRCGELKKSVLFDGEYRNELIYHGTVDDFNSLWSDDFGVVEW